MSDRGLPLWKRGIDGFLIFVAIYRLFISYTVDVAIALGYPLDPQQAAMSCPSALCRIESKILAAIHMDLAGYARSGADPVFAAMRFPVRMMAAFCFSFYAPFLLVLVYALWTRREAIRVPAIAVAVLMLYLMIQVLAEGLFGVPRSSDPTMMFLANSIDLVAPILILARVIPRPLFGAPR